MHIKPTKTLYVCNLNDQLNLIFADSASVTNPDSAKGVMAIKNFEFKSAWFGFQTYAYSEQATFGMVFKRPNPLGAIAALVPGAIGGLLAAINVFDSLVNFATVTLKFIKNLAWSAGADPLVLDLTGRGLATSQLEGSTVHFDLNNDFFSERTGWIGRGSGFLTLDKNGNGVVDDVSEMFGSFTGSGFGDLAAYDLNHDGVIDASDAVYSKLRIWQDDNGDGISTPDELRSLADLGIASISVTPTSHPNGTNPQGNTIRDVGAFTGADGTTGKAYDVVFATDQADTIYRGESGLATWSPAITVKGFGTVTDLSVAIANDNFVSDLKEVA